METDPAPSVPPVVESIGYILGVGYTHLPEAGTWLVLLSPTLAVEVLDEGGTVIVRVLRLVNIHNETEQPDTLGSATFAGDLADPGRVAGFLSSFFAQLPTISLN